MIQAIPIPLKKESFITRIQNYLQVGYLLHSIGVCSAITSWLIFNLTVQFVTTENLVLFIFLLWFSSFFFMNALFSQLDAYSRYQNFKQVRDQLFMHGYQQRIVKPMAKSSCQRVAALTAGRKLGVDTEIKALYDSMGYRWYNVLPDFIQQNPLFFFHPLFWRTTFFVKYYKSRHF